MPSIKCAHCGYKILLPTPVTVCGNCGTPFTVSGTGSTTGASATGAAPLPPLPPPHPTPFSGPAHPVPAPAGPTTTTAKPPKPYPPTSWAVPTGMLSRKPDLQGTVIIPPMRDSVESPLDWSHIVLRIMFFLLMFPFFLRDLLKAKTASRPAIAVQIVRIQRADGTICEARFENDFTSGSLSLSDRISLWGHKRAGVLVVSRAYNHDTGAQIRLRQSPMLFLSRLAAIFLPIIFTVFLVWFIPFIPSILHTLLVFFILGLVFYFLIVLFIPGIPRRVVPFLVGFLLLYAILSAFVYASTHLHP